MDKDVVLDALSALCNANVTSFQKQGRQVGLCRPFPPQQQQQLSIKNFISTVLDADETCQVSRSNFVCLKSMLQGGELAPSFLHCSAVQTPPTEINHIIDEDEFFDPRFDYDFTSLKDTETFYRGGEVYERPCGWKRFALKVLNKYDGNAWLGTRYRSTQSVPGEWPVSYHGTSKKGAEGIIEGYYKPGPRQKYGRGIYTTPYISDAIRYAKTFTCHKTGKSYKVILQNRINPQYREKCKKENYWLVPIPEGKSDQDKRKFVEKAIRPYGLLLKEVKQSQKGHKITKKSLF